MTGPNQVTGFTDDDGLIVFSKGDPNIEVVVENMREYWALSSSQLSQEKLKVWTERFMESKEEELILSAKFKSFLS